MLAFPHLGKRQERGFTLTELLVVIAILGILAGIALPVMLNQVNKAKESEAKQNLGVCARSQQAYFEQNANFADTLEKLGSGIPAETHNYKYSASAETLQDSENNIKSIGCCMAEGKIPGIETYVNCTGN
ncbi:MAG: prepilin-type N-terminal cleavage/methylation domain-containing protein [Oscillatoria princeps RMCB-10]|jgi:type IV pilus assembly protein PilA|nr:prepilin-type N-terminal cleavage/methylation domain-containing protein [Oscillatoria princeps RMCB-10]